MLPRLRVAWRIGDACGSMYEAPSYEPVLVQLDVDRLGSCSLLCILLISPYVLV